MVTRLAMAFGAVFVLVGVLGMVTAGGMGMSAEPPAAMLLGLFPVNLLHNLVHIAVGVWGILSAKSFELSKLFCAVSGAVYVLLACLGLINASTFGLIPIGGYDVWLHAGLGLVLLGVGVTAKPPAAVTA